MPTPYERYEFDIRIDDIRRSARAAADDALADSDTVSSNKRSTARTAALFMPVLGCALIGFVYTINRLTGSSPPGDAFLIITASLTALGIVAAILFHKKEIRDDVIDSYYYYVLPTMLGPSTLQLFDEGVEFATPTARVRVPWGAVTDVRLNAHSVIIETKASRWDLPVIRFPNPERFVQQANARRQAAHPIRSSGLGGELRTHGVRCVKCKYDLAGCEEQECPECGLPVVLSIREHFEGDTKGGKRRSFRLSRD